MQTTGAKDKPAEQQVAGVEAMSGVLKQGQRPYGRDFKPMPEEVPALELVPTEEELLAADRARAAFKADQRRFQWSDQDALGHQVQRSRGAL